MTEESRLGYLADAEIESDYMCTHEPGRGFINSSHYRECRKASVKREYRPDAGSPPRATNALERLVARETRLTESGARRLIRKR